VSFAIIDLKQIQNQLGSVANQAALRQFFPQQLEDTPWDRPADLSADHMAP